MAETSRELLTDRNGNDVNSIPGARRIDMRQVQRGRSEPRTSDVFRSRKLKDDRRRGRQLRLLAPSSPTKLSTSVFGVKSADDSTQSQRPSITTANLGKLWILRLPARSKRAKTHRAHKWHEISVQKRADKSDKSSKTWTQSDRNAKSKSIHQHV